MFNGKFYLRLSILFFLAAVVLCPQQSDASEILKLSVDPEEFSWVEVEDGFYRGDLRSGRRARVPGAWDVPFIPVQILPPTGFRLDVVNILETEWQPVEPPAGGLARYRLESVLGRHGDILPVVRKLPGGYRRGVAIDGLLVSPLQPGHHGGYRLLTHMTLEVSFVPDTHMDVVRPLRGNRWKDVSWAEGKVRRFGSRVPDTPTRTKGPKFFSPRHRPSLDGSAVPYVIVTVEDFEEALAPLAQWRTETGLPAVIRTMEWINETYSGVDAAERLRNFIQDATRYWGTEYVLLAGDPPWVPMRYGKTTFYGGSEIPTDLYFQCLDGTWNANGNADFGEAPAPRLGIASDDADIIADVWLGRTPIQSVGDAQVFVEKLLNYEQGEHGSPQSALIFAEVLFPQNWDPGSGTYIDGATLAEHIAGTLSAGSYTTRRLYENNVPYQGAVAETLSTVVEELNQGGGIAIHVGHGSYLSMSVGLGGKTLTRPIADGLTNSGNEFFLYSVNCTSAALDFDAIAKHFLRNPHGGAFAGVGSTRFDFPGASDPYDKGFFRLAITDGLTVGQALADIKLVELLVAQIDSADRWTVLTLVLLSDPALRLWNAPPQVFTVAHETEGMQGSVLPVTVSGPGGAVVGAQVVLFEPGGLWVSETTDEEGRAYVPLSTSGTGDVTLSVMSPNFVPYQSTVLVTPQSLEALPVLTGTQIDGDNESCILAGDHEIVTWSVANKGSGILTGIQVQPQSDLNFTYLSGPTTLTPGETGEFSFSLSVPFSLGDLETVPVELSIIADQGNWELNTALHGTAPILGIYELGQEEILGNGNGIAEVGEEFLLNLSIINTGTGEALLDNVHLTPVQGAEVLTETLSLGGIPAGSVVSVEAIHVRITSGLPLFKLSYGARTLRESLDLMDPDPPGVVGISGGSNSIRLTWEPSGSKDVARYVLESSTQEEGPFERISPWGQSASGVYVDEPLPEFAVRYYRIASQDSSGNMSDPSYPVRGTTGLAQKSGFPLDCGAETGTSPIVADLDGDGILELITGGRQIYVLHGDGTELIDGDHDVRTQGVFSDVEGEVGFFASPAVGDLDGDGRLEVVAVLAKAGLLYVWDANGTVLPGWPVALETFGGTVWVQSSPTLLDFDGDGDLEIALHAGEAVNVFHHDGQEFNNGDNDPSTSGVFFVTGARFTYTSPAAWDLDNDGKQELIVAARNGVLHILKSDGSAWPGYPLTFAGELTSSPAVADLDGDGSPEIILGTGGQNISGPDSLEVRRLDGSSLPGWPQPVLMNQDISSSPAIADWDDDGDYEVCLVSGNTTIYVWNADGTSVPGFPLRFFDSLGNPMGARGSPAIHNLDADGDLEAAFTNQDGWLYGVNYDGTLVEGFPIRHGGGIEGCPLIADLNNDGFNELCVTGLDAKINLYSTPGVALERRGWPMLQGNAFHTGSPLTEFEGVGSLQLFLGVLQTPHLPGQATAYLSATANLDELPSMTLDGTPLLVEATESTPPLYRAILDLVPGSHTLVAQAQSVHGAEGEVSKQFDVLLLPLTPAWTSWVAGIQAFVEGPYQAPGTLLLMRDSGPETPWAPRGEGEKILLGVPGSSAPVGTQVRFAYPQEWLHGVVQEWNGVGWADAHHLVESPGVLTIQVNQWGWFRLQERQDSVRIVPVLTVGPPVPNPSLGIAHVSLSLTVADEVRITVVDIRGRIVRTLENRRFGAGSHVITWDGTDNLGGNTSAGVFFIHVQSSASSIVRRLVRVSGKESP